MTTYDDKGFVFMEPSREEKITHVHTHSHTHTHISVTKRIFK